MAHKVIWSPTALRQLEAIFEYIALDSENRAASTIEKIVRSVERLETFPFIGRRFPGHRSEDFREILVFSWRIVYRVSEYDIDISEIIHGAQRWSG